MVYKPVGADENGKFPPRVETALNTTYAQLVVSDTEPPAPTGGAKLLWLKPYEILSDDPDLRARWVANKLTGANGTAVTSFAPTYGSWTTPLTAPAAAPLVKTNAVNGRKSLAFTAASSHYMDATFTAPQAVPATIFAVFKMTTYSRVFTGIAASTPGWLGLRSIGGDYLYPNAYGDTGSANHPQQPWTPTQGWTIAAVVYNGTSSKLYMNKLTPGSGVLLDAIGPMSSLRLGRGSDASAEYANIEFADLAVVGRAMTDTQVKATMNRYATEYGIALGA